MKRFRTETKRFRGYDYSFPGNYFITVCTNSRNPYFGQIINGKMILSDMGICLKNELLKTPEIRSDMNLTIDEYVIMPNHFHVIINIGRNRYNDFEYNRRIAKRSDPTNANRIIHDGPVNGDPTNANRIIHDGPVNGDPVFIQKTRFHNEFVPQTKNISSVIRGIKSAVTTYARITQTRFNWQPRFYDRIIRSDPELKRIRKYILENPRKWKGQD